MRYIKLILKAASLKQVWNNLSFANEPTVKLHQGSETESDLIFTDNKAGHANTIQAKTVFQNDALQTDEKRAKPLKMKKRKGTRFGLSKNDLVSLLAAYSSGEPIATIVKRFSVTPKKIYRITYLTKTVREKIRTRFGLSESDLAGLLAAYRSGDPIATIAKRFSVTPEKIYRVTYLTKTERNKKSTRFGLSESDLAGLLAAYKSGEPISVIAKRFSVRPEKIYRVAFLTKTAREELTDKKLADAVLIAYKNDEKIASIAERFSMSQARIMRLLSSNNGKRFSKITPEIIEAVTVAYKNGDRVPDIAIFLMLNEAKVYNILKINKVPMQTRTAFTGLPDHELSPYVLRRKENHKQALLEHLKEKAKRLGRIPMKQDMNQDKKHHYMQYYRAFGSFKAALALAGMTIIATERRIKREGLKNEMLAELRNFYNQYGTWITDDTTIPCKYTYSEYVQQFKSMITASRKAGIPVPKQRSQTHYSSEDLLNHIKMMQQQLGRNPHIKDLKNQDNYYSCSLYARRFGSWNKALIVAGLEPNRDFDYRKSEEEELLF